MSDGTKKCSKRGANDDARMVHVHDYHHDYNGDRYRSSGAGINWASSWKVGQRLALETLNAILVCAAQRDFFHCQYTHPHENIHRRLQQQSRWPMKFIFSGQWEPGLKLNRVSTAGAVIEPHISKLVPLLLQILDLAVAPQGSSGTSVRSFLEFKPALLSAPSSQPAPHEADERCGVVVAALQCLAVLLILRHGDGSSILDSLQLDRGVGAEAILLRFTDLVLRQSDSSNDTSRITCQAAALDSLCLGIGGLEFCYSFSDIPPHLIPSALSPSNTKSSSGGRMHEGSRFLRRMLLPRLITSVRDCRDEKNERCDRESAALHVLRYVMALPVSAFGDRCDDEDPVVAAAPPLGVSLSELVLLAASLVAESRQMGKQRQCWLAVERAVRLIQTAARILDACVQSDGSSVSPLASKRATTVCSALLLENRNGERTRERSRQSFEGGFMKEQNHVFSPPSLQLPSLSTGNEAAQTRHRTTGAPAVALITSIKALASAAHPYPKKSAIKAVVDESCALLRSTVAYVAILERVDNREEVLASSEIRSALCELFTCLVSIVEHPGNDDNNSGSAGGFEGMGLVKLLAVVVDSLPVEVLRYLLSHMSGANDIPAVSSTAKSIVVEGGTTPRQSRASARSFLDSLLLSSLGKNRSWQSAIKSPSFTPQDDDDCETAARCLCEALRKLSLTPMNDRSYQDVWSLESWIGNLVTSPKANSVGDDLGGIFNPLRILCSWAQASTSACHSHFAYRCSRTFMWLARGALSRSPSINHALWNQIAGHIVEILVC